VGCAQPWFVVLSMRMLDLLVRLMRVVHGTVGITEPRPEQERYVALLWVALFLVLTGVFVIGLFVIG